MLEDELDGCSAQAAAVTTSPFSVSLHENSTLAGYTDTTDSPPETVHKRTLSPSRFGSGAIESFPFLNSGITSFDGRMILPNETKSAADGDDNTIAVFLSPTNETSVGWMDDGFATDRMAVIAGNASIETLFLSHSTTAVAVEFSAAAMTGERVLIDVVPFSVTK